MEELLSMNYQSYQAYGSGSRPLPRPSSSGTLSGGSEFEPASKRARVQQSPVPPVAYQAQIQSSLAQPQPYHAQQPYGGRPVPQPYAMNQWSPEPYYQEPQQVARQQNPELRKVEEAVEENESEEDEEEPVEADSGMEGSVVSVPGTSITLNTMEDIEKWREERKRMWLLKISNNKLKHMQSMGIQEDELKGQKGPLHEAKKQKQFIQSIQSQVSRINPKSTLSGKVAQREMARENSKLLDLIGKLGDANLLSYELSEEEKEKLFGSSTQNDRRGRTNHNNNSGFRKNTINASNGANKNHRHL